MRGFKRYLWTGLLLLSAGCSLLKGGSADPLGEVVQDGETIPVYFPVYLLLEGDVLNKHGFVPATELVGAEITSSLALEEVAEKYDKVFAQEGWRVEQQAYSGAVRLKATRGDEFAEIRSVQGTEGPTEIFILYSASLAHSSISGSR